MRVTRKVFSIYDENFISEVEERAFCQGYYAAAEEEEEKTFGRKNEEDKKGLTENQKLGLAALGTSGATAAGMYGLSKVEGRSKKDKITSKLRNWIGKNIQKVDVKSEKLNDKIKSAGKKVEEGATAKARNAIIDNAEELGKVIKENWNKTVTEEAKLGYGSGKTKTVANWKGRGKLAAAAALPGAAIVGGAKAIKAAKKED